MKDLFTFKDFILFRPKRDRLNLSSIMSFSFFRVNKIESNVVTSLETATGGGGAAAVSPFKREKKRFKP